MITDQMVRAAWLAGAKWGIGEAGGAWFVSDQHDGGSTLDMVGSREEAGAEQNRRNTLAMLEAAERASWIPIATAPKGCCVDRGLTIDGRAWTSETIWVRDADGRTYEAWFVEDGEYWWDADGETQCEPVEWMPHPLWKSEG